MPTEITLHNRGRVEISISDKLSAEDYQRIVPALKQAIQQHQKIRVLAQISNFTGLSSGGVLEELKFDRLHAGDIERLAVVGQHLWNRGYGAFPHPLPAPEFRHFHAGHADEARAWLGESAVSTTRA